MAALLRLLSGSLATHLLLFDDCDALAALLLLAPPRGCNSSSATVEEEDKKQKKREERRREVVAALSCLAKALGARRCLRLLRDLLYL